MAVFGHIVPVTVVIQILITNHVFGHVLARPGMIPACIALLTESLEIICLRQTVALVILQLRIVERHRLTFLDLEARVALAVGIAAPMDNGDGRRLAIGFDGNAIFADTTDDESQRWRIDFVGLVVIQTAHAQVQRTLREFNLCGLVVQVQEIETGVLIHAYRGRADFQLGARIAIGPQLVAANQRPIELGLDPIVLTRRHEAYVAANERETGDTGGWIGALVVGRRLRQRGKSQRHAGQQDSEMNWSEHGERSFASRGKNRISTFGDECRTTVLKSAPDVYLFCAAI